MLEESNAFGERGLLDFWVGNWYETSNTEPNGVLHRLRRHFSATPSLCKLVLFGDNLIDGLLENSYCLLNFSFEISNLEITLPVPLGIETGEQKQLEAFNRRCTYLKLNSSVMSLYRNRKHVR